MLRLLELDAEHGVRFLDPGYEDEVDAPAYAILSHTWSRDPDYEVTYDDIVNGTATNKPGFEKLQFCGLQARKHGLLYFWVDSCCINKQDMEELSIAIQSMFRWYKKSTRCYVYLSDAVFNNIALEDHDAWDKAFRGSYWFKRGWTLQELVAPRHLSFYARRSSGSPQSVDALNQRYHAIGSREELLDEILEITGIPAEAFKSTKAMRKLDPSTRKSWMDGRKTQKKEDRAYSLQGIMDVSFPPVYGEGYKQACRRLESAYLLEHNRRLERPFSPNKRNNIIHRRKPYRVLSLPRNLDFVGRANALQDVDAHLQSHRMVNLWGDLYTASQCALKYVYDQLDKQSDELLSVFWIDARSTYSLDRGFRDVAKALKLTSLEDEPLPLGKVQEWLYNSNNGHWILVLDNVKSEDILTSTTFPLSGFLQPPSHGRAIVTSAAQLPTAIYAEAQVEVEAADKAQSISPSMPTMVRHIATTLVASPHAHVSKDLLLALLGAYVDHQVQSTDNSNSYLHRSQYSEAEEAIKSFLDSGILTESTTKGAYNILCSDRLNLSETGEEEVSVLDILGKSYPQTLKYGVHAELHPNCDACLLLVRVTADAYAMFHPALPPAPTLQLPQEQEDLLIPESLPFPLLSIQSPSKSLKRPATTSDAPNKRLKTENPALATTENHADTNGPGVNTGWPVLLTNAALFASCLSDTALFERLRTAATEALTLSEMDVQQLKPAEVKLFLALGVDLASQGKGKAPAQASSLGYIDGLACTAWETAFSLFEKGDSDAAIKFLKDSISENTVVDLDGQVNPESAQNSCALAMIYLTQDNLPAARDTLKPLCMHYGVAHPDVPSICYFDYSFVLCELLKREQSFTDMLKAAERAYDLALACVDPRQPILYNVTELFINATRLHPEASLPETLARVNIIVDYCRAQYGNNDSVTLGFIELVESAHEKNTVGSTAATDLVPRLSVLSSGSRGSARSFSDDSVSKFVHTYENTYTNPFGGFNWESNFNRPLEGCLLSGQLDYNPFESNPDDPFGGFNWESNFNRPLEGCLLSGQLDYNPFESNPDDPFGGFNWESNFNRPLEGCLLSGQLDYNPFESNPDDPFGVSYFLEATGEDKEEGKP